MDNLKPCPFCGREVATVEKTRLDGEGRYYVYCPSCEARGSDAWCASVAIDRWNDVWNNKDISLPELKSCPFCGGKANAFICGSIFGVECESCGTSSDGFDTKQEAVEAWNRRADDEEQ